MTSRFGKTYSRKGGEGTSKFDEVLSNKRATLSTKWGETTYKAKVSSKRMAPAAAARRDSVLDVHKRPRLSGDCSEDPYGFDSDDESKTVSSRAPAKPSPAKPSPAKPAYAEPPQAERPGYSLDTSSKSSATLQGWSSALSRGSSAAFSSDRSQPRVLENTAVFFNTTTTTSSTTGNKSQLGSSPAASEKQHSYSWYRNASESDKKPLALTTTLKSESKADSWDTIMGLPSPSQSHVPRNPPSTQWASAVSATSVYGLGLGRGLGAEPGRTREKEEEKVPSPPRPQSPGEREDFGSGWDIPVEPSEDQSQTSSSSLLRSTNCRTYRRPNKQAPGKSSDSSASEAPGAGLPKNPADTSNKPSGSGPGRARDYTVLHPSCLSVCNVTIQERGAEDFTRSVIDLGEAVWQQKKSEVEVAKPRVRPAQSKAKKDTKTDLFGFEDPNAPQGGDIKKAKSPMEVARPESPVCLDMPVDSPPDPFESWGGLEELEAKEKKSTEAIRPVSSMRTEQALGDSLAFAESLRVAQALFAPRRPANNSKQAEKHQESHRRIFKKSPTKAVYNARHWAVDSEEEAPPVFSSSRSQTTPAVASGSAKDPGSSGSQKDDGVFKAPPPPPKVIKSVTIPTEPYQDMLFTVVRHVKHFNDVVEFGENQEFTDDFEYLATGLKSGQPLNTRCLSVISLAMRCAMPSFRMHLRARGKVAQVFNTLNDAPQQPNLALCTAALIAREMAKVKEKIRKLCEMVHNKHLDLENITTGHLAMETLLSLTSKRAGDWFKEELRLLGGLDHIVDKGHAYKDSSLIISSAKALWSCEAMIQRYSRQVNRARCSDGTSLPFCSNSNVGKAVEDCMRAIIGVLEQRFDIRVLGLGLLINLVEYSARNKHCLMEMELEVEVSQADLTILPGPQPTDLPTTTCSLNAIAALLFLQRERAALLAESQTDDLIKEPPKPLDQSGQWQESSGEIQWVANDNVAPPVPEITLLHAGKHMEDSFVASYTALLLGCLCQGSSMNVTTVRENLPKGDFSILTEMLKKFLNFMNLTCDIGTAGHKSISKVIDYLEHC
ncbi:hypothetical protein NHX12_025156 [Muraenolepis orangiensis]|uniref:WAPL domain-containing protein n=1 Tax=Muraenolepis orangiensis TaxID=630683 RepID=A0A9Q0EJP6_9TELE|nr:hypothetical protein NHX12_025156 [Muraenolepis orangiensis]